MITRALAFLVDLIVFLFVYCFLYVSILILLFDRNTDYDRFLPMFYIGMGITGYLYFILPLLLTGKTLGKRIFRINITTINGWKNITLIHVKYIVFRFFPIVAILLLFDTSSIIIQVLLGITIIYPIFDYIYLKLFEHTFTDKLLNITVNVY